MRLDCFLMFVCGTFLVFSPYLAVIGVAAVLIAEYTVLMEEIE